MKKTTLKKAVAIVCACLAALLATAAIAIGALWGNEISSVASIKQIADANEQNKSAPVYLMDVKGDYYFDDFLK